MTDNGGEPPRIGRYRLYDREGKGHLRCRICGEKVRFDNQWLHKVRELDKAASLPDLDIALLRLGNVLWRERAKHWRKRTQYYHEKARKESGVELR